MNLRRTVGAWALALAFGCQPSDFSRVERDDTPPPDEDGGSLSPSDDAGAEPPPDGASEQPPDATTLQPDARVDGGSELAPDGGSDGGAGVPDGGPMMTGCTPAPDGGRPLRPSPPVELGRLVHPASIASRRLGPSALLGSRRTWLLTFTEVAGGVTAPVDAPGNYPTYAQDGAERPWESQPLAPPAPFRLAEQLSAELPRPLVALPLAEQKMGLNLTPTSLVRSSDTASGGLVFLQQGRGFSDPVTVWLADLPDNGGQATRHAGPLFEAASEPLFSLGAFRGSEYLTVYACDKEHRCVVARAPLARVDQHDAYEVRTKSASGVWSWSRDLTSGTPVLEGAWLDLSVSYNAYLGKYLAVSSKLLTNTVVLRTAPAPEGPWSEPAELPLPMPIAWVTMYAREQPALAPASTCGKRVVISHWSPDRIVGGYPAGGDVVLSAIELQ